MKKITTVLFSLTILFLQAQLIEDSVSTNANYATQSFYSLENGEVSNVDNMNWDIAFSIASTGASGSAILFNELNADLWAVPQDTSFWSAFDTTGYTSWKRLLNSDTTWTNGAYNKHRGMGPGGTFDMGWGYLDPSNNFWTLGDSLYLCKLNSGAFKKVWIESLKQGVWSFRYADIDGSNDTTISLTKADYSNKNFIYFSMENNEIIDREPDNTTWELTFAAHKVLVVTPFSSFYTSSLSVYSNVDIWTAKAHSVTYADAIATTEADTEFTQTINNIGGEWKSRVGGVWQVNDTISYFVYDNDSADFYRMVFTGFDGLSTGKSFFNKEKMGSVAINSIENNVNLSFYPNPAIENVTVLINIEKSEKCTINIVNVSGQLVSQTSINANAGTLSKAIDVSNLNTGIYFIQVSGETFNVSEKLLIK